MTSYMATSGYCLMVKLELSPNLKVQTLEFTYSSDNVLKTIVAYKCAILVPLHIQQGWGVRPLIIIASGIRRAIHTTTTKCLQDVQMPTLEIHNLMESFSQLAMRYLGPVHMNSQILSPKSLEVNLCNLSH